MAVVIICSDFGAHRLLYPWDSPGKNTGVHSGKLLQAFKEEIIPILHKLSQKVKEEEILPKIFYDASITLI